MRVQVDLGAYERNIALLKARLAPADLMAVVKDDAYGHGLERIVPAALTAGVSKFAVLDISTGLKVRQLCGDREAQLFAWLFEPEADFAAARTSRIDLGISHARVLEAAAAADSKLPARVHLKIDTGLHRNGSSQAAWPALCDRAAQLQVAGAIEVVGVWSHIGEASDAEDARSRQRFEDAISIAAESGLTISQRHLAASAASFEREDFRYDFARVGGFTYGVAPGDGIGPAQLGLEAVMTAYAIVSSVVEENGRTLAALDAGFVDGIPDWVVRPGEVDHLPQGGFDVTIAGVRASVLSVEAQRLIVDVTHMEDVRVGDEAVLFGSHRDGAPVLQEWADALGTVGEEIVVRVGPTSSRSYSA